MISLLIANERYFGHKDLPDMSMSELEDYVTKALVGQKNVDQVGARHGGNMTARLPKRREQKRINIKHILGLDACEKSVKSWCKRCGKDHVPVCSKCGAKSGPGHDFRSMHGPCDKCAFKKGLEFGACPECGAEWDLHEGCVNIDCRLCKVFARALRKAILTKTTASREAASTKKMQAPRAPAAASKVTSSGGSKQYRYPEKNAARDRKGGKGKPPSKGLESSPTAAPEPPQAVKPVNPEHFASLLHVEVDDLRKLALRFPVEKFIGYIHAHFPALVKVHKIPRTYLEELHEALTQRQPQPVEKGLRGHKQYTRRSKSGKISLIVAKPGERMNRKEIDQLRLKHVHVTGSKIDRLRAKGESHLPKGPVKANNLPPSVMAAKFKVGDTVKHSEMGLGVVTSVGLGQPNLLQVSFTSHNERYARTHPKGAAAHAKKYKRPFDTETTVGAQFVNKVQLKSGGPTDALRARVVNVGRR